MMKKPENVAVICGGDSAEREVSLKTGKAVIEALKTAECSVFEFDTDRDLGRQLLDKNIDAAFIALHGRGGEDGVIQGLLEWYGIPYTGPGVAASAICMDKVLSKRLYEQLEIPTANWFVIDSDQPVENSAGFKKMVVKPRLEGSSIGMSIVESDGLQTAVEKARRYCSQVLVEEYISGYEVTVGVVELEEQLFLPPVGIRSSHDYFDYETKYTKGLTEYDVPAPLEAEILNKLIARTNKVTHALGTESLSRVDYILKEDKEPVLLEINTVPGLTATSLLPMAAKSAGIEFEQLVWQLVCRALEREKNA
ncbi:MAG: D-alanine--D-alanine ligase [bacterium]